VGHILPWECAYVLSLLISKERSTSVKKGQHEFSISCESLASGKANIGIWLKNTGIPEGIESELLRVLLQWTGQFEETFVIYGSNNELATSE